MSVNRSVPASAPGREVDDPNAVRPSVRQDHKHALSQAARHCLASLFHNPEHRLGSLSKIAVRCLFP